MVFGYEPIITLICTFPSPIPNFSRVLKDLMQAQFPTGSPAKSLRLPYPIYNGCIRELLHGTLPSAMFRRINLIDIEHLIYYFSG